MPAIPYKSTSLAILFGIVLGPIGLLYGARYLACIFMVLGFFVVGSGLFLPIGLLWIVSTALNVFAVERHNRKLFKFHSEWFLTCKTPPLIETEHRS